MGKPIKSEKGSSDSAARVRKHRDKMRTMGLKPVTLWLPDTKSPEFRTQVARDIAIINADAEGMRVMEEMLALADFSDRK